MKTQRRKQLEWTQFGLLALLVFLIPLQTRYFFTDPGLNGAVWEAGRISVYAFDIVFLFLLAHARYFWNVTRDARWTYFALFLLVLILSVVNAVEVPLAIYRIVRVAQAMFLFGVLMRMTDKFRNGVMAAWVSAGIIQSLVALSQFILQSFPGSKWLGLAALNPGVLGTAVIETLDGRFLRAYGTFSHPNILAGFLTIGIVIALKLYKKTDDPRMRMLAAVAFMVQQVGLFMTFSRTGVVAAGVALFIIITYRLYKWTKVNHPPLQQLWRAPAILLVVVVFWTSLGYAFRDLWLPRIVIEGRIEEQSISLREQSIVDSLQLWYAEPVLGVGAGNATVVLSELNPEQNGLEVQPPHNMALLILFEAGILGVALGALMCAGFMWKVLQQNPVHSISFAGLAMIFVLSMFDHYFWTQGSGILMFWLGIAVFQPTALREGKQD